MQSPEYFEEIFWIFNFYAPKLKFNNTPYKAFAFHLSPNEGQLKFDQIS